MKLSLIVVLLLILQCLILLCPNKGSTTSLDIQYHETLPEKPLPGDVKNLLTSIPKAFTENRGQLDNDDVRFYAQDGSVWFTDDGIFIEVKEEFSMTSRQSTGDSPESRLATDDWRPMTNEYERIVVKQEFVGANHVMPVGRERLSWNSNFFYGNDSVKWYTDVSNYAEIYYKNIYNGIDIRYYSLEKGLKYDFIIHPGGDVNQIRIKYDGAEKLKLDDIGNLIIKTSIHNIKDGDLCIYQNYMGTRHPINGNFKIFNDFEYGFELLQDYYKQEYLIIDPLIYSTYIGGLENESIGSIAVDSNGCSYITGGTGSSNFPTTAGAYDTNIYGMWDMFVLKLNPMGSALIYSTFIGGASIEFGADIIIDSNGNAFITGDTTSGDFPTTLNAYDRIHRGSFDCFVVKLNHNGSKLIYSTYVGSFTEDSGSGIAIDPAGNAYITGTTFIDPFPYKRFPTTPGAFDESHNGAYEPFIFKLNSSGDSLLYSTFFGGGSSDWGNDIIIDSNGYVFITGATHSGNFPTTEGAFDTSHNDKSDCFVLKLNLSGAGSSDLIYSTFVGGNDWDWANAITLTVYGETIITGYTTSLDFPTTREAYDKTYNSGTDCFIFELNNRASGLIFSTYLGGNDIDEGHDIAIDQIGDIYISGVTNSSNFPTTFNAYDNTCNNGDYFLSKLSQDGKWLIYSTFIGGSNEKSYGYPSCEIWISNVGIVYMSGFTYSNDFPTTPGAFNRTYAGYSDIFVLKLSITPVFKVSSISLLDNDIPITKTYTRYQNYTFRVILNDTVSPFNVKTIRLILNPENSNIQLIWNRSTGRFEEFYDPNDHIRIENSSKIYYNFPIWTIDFNVTFNWTFPNEDLKNIQAYAISEILPPRFFNFSKNYHVENDLIFIGNLSVIGEDDRILNANNNLARGGEALNWSGLITIYENTEDLYPPVDEFKITIWNSNGYFWSTLQESGYSFNVTTITSNITNLIGDEHIINITGIPPECDKTNESFIIRIDGENVKFSNPRPETNSWQIDTSVYVGITITDYGGGLVDGKNIKYKTSIDNGTTWGSWFLTPEVLSGSTIEMETMVAFKNGKENLIKWCASDTAGNGPVESDTFRVFVDNEDVLFSNPWPLIINRSSLDNVDVGITIFDNNSGVNAKTIEYSISENGGKTWGPWTVIEGYENDMNIQVKLNVVLNNRTENRIRWRARDIAGNGPTKSKVYIMEVIKPIPRARLISPLNGSRVNTSKVKLVWEMEDKDIDGTLMYKIIFGPSYPPSDAYWQSESKTYLELEPLSDNITYYWKIDIIIDGVKKYPGNEIWWFKIKLEPIKVKNIYNIEIGGAEFLSLFQGENGSIELSITNKGNIEDNIELEISSRNLSPYIRLNDNSPLELSSKKIGSRIIIIELPKKINPGNYEINITAISLNSDRQIKDFHIITIEIKELIIPGDNDFNKTTEQKPNYIYWYLIVIIIIILLLAIFIIIIQRRKPKAEKDKSEEKSILTKPEKSITQEIGTDEQLTAYSLPQLQKVITANSSQKPISASTPQLVKSTQVTQESIKAPQTNIPQLPSSQKNN